MKKLSELSLFFPFWNEEANVKKAVNGAIPILHEVAEKWEIIIVDDGSEDNTLKVASQLAKENSKIRVISHKPNRGYGAALKEGLVNARYEYIVFTDGDLQFDFAEVTNFIEKIESADIVIGYRKKREDKFIRHILMNLLKVWDFIFFQFYFKDIDCGFKMFRRSSIEKIMPFRSEGAMITTEILAKAKAKKLRIKEVGVTHYPRKFGEQSGSNIFVIIRAILESFVLFMDIRSKRF